MSLDLTSVRAGISDVIRDLLRGDELKLKLLKGETVLCEIDRGWNYREVDHRATGGKKYVRLTVFEDGQVSELRKHLLTCTAFQFKDQTFKKADRNAIINATKKYIFDLQPLGA